MWGPCSSWASDQGEEEGDGDEGRDDGQPAAGLQRVDYRLPLRRLGRLGQHEARVLNIIWISVVWGQSNITQVTRLRCYSYSTVICDTELTYVLHPVRDHVQVGPADVRLLVLQLPH